MVDSLAYVLSVVTIVGAFAILFGAITLFFRIWQLFDETKETLVKVKSLEEKLEDWEAGDEE